jgi:peptide/nickel transport system permease protein
MIKVLRYLAWAVLGTVLLAVGSARWLPHRYNEQFREHVDGRPSMDFPLGTDELGRDRLSRLIYGCQVSLALAPIAASASVLIAIISGTIAAVLGRWADRVFDGITSLFLSLPWLFAILTIRACLPLEMSPLGTLTITFSLLSAVGWAAPARIIRGAVENMLKSDYVLMAKASGIPPCRIWLEQMIPNVWPVAISQLCVQIPVFILAEANLGLLGLGVAEPLPSLGGLLRELESLQFMSSPVILAPLLLLVLITGSAHILIYKGPTP